MNLFYWVSWAKEAMLAVKFFSRDLSLIKLKELEL